MALNGASRGAHIPMITNNIEVPANTVAMFI